MPKLIVNTTKRLYLPSTEGLAEEEKAWVEVKDRLTGGDWVAAMVGADAARRTDIGLSMFIVNWNFTGLEGAVEPITPESVHRLELKDYNFLSQELMAASEAIVSSIKGDQKKTLSSTSTPPIPGVNPT